MQRSFFQPGFVRDCIECAVRVKMALYAHSKPILPYLPTLHCHKPAQNVERNVQSQLISIHSTLKCYDGKEPHLQKLPGISTRFCKCYFLLVTRKNTGTNSLKYKICMCPLFSGSHNYKSLKRMSCFAT